MMYPTLNVVDVAIDQVQDKMKLFESRAASFTSKLNESMANISNLQFEYIGEAPVFNMETQLTEVPNIEIPNLDMGPIVPPVLDSEGVSIIPAPEFGTAPDINLNIDVPILQNIDNAFQPIQPNLVEGIDEINVPKIDTEISAPLLDAISLNRTPIAKPQEIPNINLEIPVPVLPETGIVVDPIQADFDYTIPKMEFEKIPAAPYEDTNFNIDSNIKLDISNLLNSLDFELPALPVAPVELAVVMPTAPTLNSPELPVKPILDYSIKLPDAPVLDFPELDKLADIVLPTLEYKEVPEFDALPPDFTLSTPEIDSAIESAIQVASEDYYAKNTDNAIKPLVAEIRSWLEGNNPGLGLPVAVEQALFNRARERANRETEKAVQEAMTEWASRGFSMPHGMLAKQVSDIRDQGRLAVADLNRDIMIQSFDKQLEHIRFLTEQGMALEKMKQDMYLAYVSNVMNAAKFQIDSHISLFNAEVSLFNAQTAAFETLVTIYKTKIEAAISKITAYKAQIDAQLAIGQVNQQKIDIFKSKIETVLTNVEVYKSLIQGESIRSDAIKNQIDIYRTEMLAYSEQLGAEKQKIDIYNANISAENARIGIYETLSKNYASTIQGISSVADLKNKQQDMKIEEARIKLQEFTTRLDANKTEISNKLAIAQNNTNNFIKHVEVIKATTQQNMSAIDLEMKALDAKQRTAIANADLQSKNVDLKSRLAIANADLQGKYMDIQFRFAMADLDAKTKYAEMISRNNISNAEMEAKYADMDIRMSSAKLEADSKVLDAKVRVAIENANLQSKQIDNVTKVKLSNSEMRNRVTTTNADIVGKYADINSRMVLAAADMQSKYMDIQFRSVIADIDAKTKYAEMHNRVNTSNTDAQTRVAEANARIKTSNAEVQARYADMQTRTMIAGAETKSRYMDMVTRTNISNAEMKARYIEANSRTNIANAEMQLKLYDVKSQKSFQKTQLAVEAAKAIGQYSAQLASGALSAMHVSASISGNGSSSTSYSASESESTSHNYTY